MPFTLLSDEDGQVSQAYRARVPLLGMTRRITYLLDQEHRVAAVYENMFNAQKHIREMIDQLKKQPTG